MLFAIPIMRGMASYSDINRLELIDFFVMNEIVLVQDENERRAHKAAEKGASK